MTSTRPRRVLVVDDDARFRAAVVSLLSDETDLVVVAAVDSADAALSIARDQPLDAAVVDVQMPGVDGVELTRRLRHSLPDLTVFALSAATDDASRSAMTAAGANRYFVKGKDTLDLVDALVRLPGANGTRRDGASHVN
ncbi:MAG TPA: response regulator transcription factor [Actinomycetales bacterium]|jgi:CheY-like chemotaxis protein|nr:response regulator transcription factor [Actinomycetales bacterium]